VEWEGGLCQKNGTNDKLNTTGAKTCARKGQNVGQSAAYLPELGTDLVTALAGLDVDDFSHAVGPSETEDQDTEHGEKLALDACSDQYTKTGFA
jgi:hypothetical protein